MARVLPKTFDDGDDFYNFVYNTWEHKDTYVECQDGSDDPDAAWVAIVGGDPLVKSATYAAGNKIVCWYSDEESQVELTEEQLNNWKQ